MNQHDRDPFQDFTIRLRSVPHDVPATSRAKRAIKCLLRSFGFRVELIPDQKPKEAEKGKNDAQQRNG